MGIILAIVVFGLIVFVHELGHFLLAKANKIRVDEFSIGMGPRICSFVKGETRYSLKILPIGGSCMMGEDDAEDVGEGSFNSKSVWARMSVIVAGAVFNFILALIFAIIVVGFTGYDEPVISGVVEGFPAEEAQMQAGDRIVKMNNKRIHLWREVTYYNMFHQGETVELVYERDGERYTTTLTPTYSEEDGRYLYGFISTLAREKVGVFEVVKYSFHEVGYWISSTIDSLKMLITGGASMNDLSGPVGIVQSIGSTYEESVANDGYYYAFLNMLNWAILLSANLGVMNLLPIPALDGGRLVFLIVEAIRRKPIDPNKEGIVHMIGILLLFALMFLVMANDIRKLFM